MARFWVFFEFWGPRGPRVGLKTSKMDSPCPKTPILTPHTCLNSLWGRNGENRAFFQKSGQTPAEFMFQVRISLGPTPPKNKLLV